MRDVREKHANATMRRTHVAERPQQVYATDYVLHPVHRVRKLLAVCYLVLGIAAVPFGWYVLPHDAWPSLTNGGTPSPVPAIAVNRDGDYTYDGPPSVSLATFRRVLCAGGNPEVCAEADEMYAALVRAGIDPVFALAHAHKETSFGTAGIGRIPNDGRRAKDATDGFRGLYGVDCNDDADYCLLGVRFGGFDSYTNATVAWATLLTRRGYIDAGLRTPAAIIARYAPTSENDTSAYIRNVIDDVDAWRAHDRAATHGRPRCGFTTTNAFAGGFYDTAAVWEALGQYGGMHLGIDFTGTPGDPVFLPWAARITDVGSYDDDARKGAFVVARLAHDNTLFYAGHLVDVYVREGQTVPACTIIGTLGATSFPHTHIKMAAADAPVPCEGVAPGAHGCIDPLPYWREHP